MKIILCFIVFGVSLADLNAFSQTRGRLDRLIANAKSRGMSEYHEDPPLVNYNRHATLYELLSDRIPLLVTVAGVMAAPDSSRETIFTHYLLKVDQNFKGVNFTPATDTSAFGNDTSSPDVNTLRIEAKQLGGTVTEQGVKITVTSPGQFLTKGRQYLLFLHRAEGGDDLVLSDGSTLAVSDSEQLQALNQASSSEAVSGLIGKRVNEAIGLVRQAF